VFRKRRYLYAIPRTGSFTSGTRSAGIFAHGLWGVPRSTACSALKIGSSVPRCMHR
jgi:hypothetical protein